MPTNLHKPDAKAVRQDHSLNSLKGVGPSVESKLNSMGIHNVNDLLFHLPSRYQDRTRICPIAQVKLGEYVQIQGEIVSQAVQFGRRRSLHCSLKDASGIISLRFFHFSAAQKQALQTETHLRCFGEIRRGRHGFELYHPEYVIIKTGESLAHEQNLTPIYPATEGLQQTRLRRIIEQALARLEAKNQLSELLPESFCTKLGFGSLKDAILELHNPSPNTPLAQLEGDIRHPAQQRLAFEELLAHRLSLRRQRLDSNFVTAPAMTPDTKLSKKLLARLGFTLTRGQSQAIAEISSDLQKSSPMLRLLQGDVGSGKTVVAAMAALQAIANGYQVALMAPTEILAEQHYLNFFQWFNELDIEVDWLSGKSKGKKREQKLQRLANGETQILVGTHALFQTGVEYHKLGLIIIDEQHRFGVHQRLSLREKAETKTFIPHQLVMTATPIPRTLAMSAYADLDCSVINELPPGRTVVNTVVVPGERRDEIIDRIAQVCAGRRQVYWVCTLIEESQVLQCQAAQATAELLQQLLPTVKIGLIHGRLKSAEKAEIMQQFKSAALQLLVATTVIEVGVDVPNASLMIIENSERLGLAQLHQLRGRVGRGAVASHCILLYQSPLNEIGKQRLSVMRESNDGFYIAERDMEMRGPGQVLGTQQTGVMNFKVADISRDADLLELVQDYSEQILHQYPELIDPLIQRWLGENVHYGNV